MPIKTASQRGKSARIKGNNFEREIAKKLSLALNCKARRSGPGFKGSDIIGLPDWLSVETKACEAWTWGYVDQMLKDAGDKTGILFWKRSNKVPLAIMTAESLLDVLHEIKGNFTQNTNQED